jgi:hypothetical protein
MCHGTVTVAQKITCHVRSLVPTAVMQMIEVFWDVMLCFSAVSSEHEEQLAE